MASSGAASVPLEPPTRASRTAFERNANVRFLKLSLEIRLIIYEYVVAREGLVIPRQVTERSNKFIWGKGTPRYIADDMGNYSKVLVSDEPPLMVTQLLKTCRQIYCDLAAYPVFYRVNLFAFERYNNTHRFLAALTPERRHMLRCIALRTCERDSTGLWKKSQLGLKPQGSINNHILVLLRDCKGLRSLDICVGNPRFQFGTTERQVKQILNDVIHHAASIPGARSFWRFPGLSIAMGARDSGHTVVIEVNGMSPYPPLATDQSHFANKPEIRQLFDLANNAMAKYKKRLCRQKVGPSPTEAELRRAIDASNVDFPGDIRVQQTRAGGLKDNGARRTRDQVKAEGQVTIWGTISQIRPKYTSEGLLRNYDPMIIDLRWNESSIEVRVVLGRHGTSISGRSSWEKIHCIANWLGLHRLRVFFSRTLAWKTSIQKLQVIENMPSPDDIDKAFEGSLDDEPPKDYLQEWVELKKLYRRCVGTLKQEVQEIEEAKRAAALAKQRAKEEAKRVRAEAKQQAKVAKHKEKLAKASAKALANASETSDIRTRKGLTDSQS